MNLPGSRPQVRDRRCAAEDGRKRRLISRSDRSTHWRRAAPPTGRWATRRGTVARVASEVRCPAAEAQARVFARSTPPTASAHANATVSASVIATTGQNHTHLSGTGRPGLASRTRGDGERPARRASSARRDGERARRCASPARREGQRAERRASRARREGARKARASSLLSSGRSSPSASAVKMQKSPASGWSDPARSFSMRRRTSRQQSTVITARPEPGSDVLPLPRGGLGPDDEDIDGDHEDHRERQDGMNRKLPVLLIAAHRSPAPAGPPRARRSPARAYCSSPCPLVSRSARR
jgi:hypothetical protein